MADDLPDFELGINVLKQALANLTSVVTATALDIRALDSNDIPHRPVPYDQQHILKQRTTSIAIGSSGSLDADEDDWGTGKDFYPDAVTVIFKNETGNDFFALRGDAIRITISEIAGATTNVIGWFEITPDTNRSYYRNGGTEMRVVWYKNIWGHKVNNGNKIDIGVENFGSDVIEKYDVVFTGVAI